MPTALTNANIVAFITGNSIFTQARTDHPGADQPLLDIANATGNDTVSGDPITASALLDLIHAGEYSTLTTIQLAQLQTIMSAGAVNVGASATQGKLSAILADYSTSLAAVEATYTRPATPWEAHFGKGQVATTQLLDDARNSNGGNQF